MSEPTPAVRRRARRKKKYVLSSSSEEEDNDASRSDRGLPPWGSGSDDGNEDDGDRDESVSGFTSASSTSSAHALVAPRGKDDSQPKSPLTDDGSQILESPSESSVRNTSSAFESGFAWSPTSGTYQGSSSEGTHSARFSTVSSEQSPSLDAEHIRDPLLQALAVEVRIKVKLTPCLTALKYHKISPRPTKMDAQIIRQAAVSALKLAKQHQSLVQAGTLARCHFYNGLTDIVYSRDAFKKTSARARKQFKLAVSIGRECQSSVDEEVLAKHWLVWIAAGGTLSRESHSDNNDSDKSIDARAAQDPGEGARSHAKGLLERWLFAFPSGRPTTPESFDSRSDTSSTDTSTQQSSQSGSQRSSTQESLEFGMRPAPLAFVRRVGLRTDILSHNSESVKEPISPGAVQEPYSPNILDQVSPKDTRPRISSLKSSSWWPPSPLKSINPRFPFESWMGNDSRVISPTSSSDSAVTEEELSTSSRAEPLKFMPFGLYTPGVTTATESTSVTPHASRRNSRVESDSDSPAPPARSLSEHRRYLNSIYQSSEEDDDTGTGTEHERRRSRLFSVTTALPWSRQAPRSPEAHLEEGDSPAHQPQRRRRSIGETW